MSQCPIFRRMCARPSPEMLQAGAVKRLKDRTDMREWVLDARSLSLIESISNRRWDNGHLCSCQVHTDLGDNVWLVCVYMVDTEEKQPSV